MYVQQYAQTNLQLYQQAINANYQEEVLQGLNTAYDLAVRLFPCRCRANGKPFLSHLVGTASILLKHDSSTSVVLAGLLHAVYRQGEFSTLNLGSAAARQPYVANLLGQEIEQLIARYTKLGWNSQNILYLLENHKILAPIDKDIIFMRLANTLENFLDLGIAFSGKDKYERQPELVTKLFDLANCLGYEQLGKELGLAYQTNASASLPSVIKRSESRSFSIASR